LVLRLNQAHFLSRRKDVDAIQAFKKTL